MLIASLICLGLLAFFVLVACVIDGLDFAGFLILLCVAIPFGTILSLVLK